MYYEILYQQVAILVMVDIETAGGLDGPAHFRVAILVMVDIETIQGT